MGIRDFVMHPEVVRDLNRAIRRAFERRRGGSGIVTRILVADDEADVRNALRAMLESAGYEVVTASNGLQAVNAHRAKPAQLVITDIFMPEVDGLETIASLKRLAPDLKIIAISSDAGPEGKTYLRAARSFGAVRTFTKPVRASELMVAIEELLGS